MAIVVCTVGLLSADPTEGVPSVARLVVPCTSTAQRVPKGNGGQAPKIQNKR
jgi:hypothetical protein